jgi:hypothetical protein
MPFLLGLRLKKLTPLKELNPKNQCGIRVLHQKVIIMRNIKEDVLWELQFKLKYVTY